MAEKDITEKILLSYADVFADCINTLVYSGKQTLSEENTRPAPTESFYKSQKPHNQFCDTSRYLTEGGNYLIQYIIENETRLEARQILRKVSYQGGAYRQQLESSAPVYGVVVAVIDWTGKTSRIPTTLHKLLELNGVPSEYLEQIDDAELKVYHMNNLSPEIRSRFTSDLGFVADYLNEGNFDRRRKQPILHPEALCDMMDAVTGDTRFTEQLKELMESRQKGENVIMCEYIDLLEANGEARLADLLAKLYGLGRDEEAKTAVLHPEVRPKLYQELSIEMHRFA